jgi:hypothetical protein
MHFFSREKLQLGQTGWILGDLPNLLAGALTLDIYSCEACGKVEFFAAEESNENGRNNDYESGNIKSRTCPQCGHKHDIDYPKCPYCRHDYTATR